ncbi:uncharacterized protein lrrc53 [Siphateles boraxobius]|uniref:uncharacterized protein lrrc53 n=1 Tax=Siphateles boraxobius TaxID=180520 RepID=UPI0040649ED6
MRSICLLLMLTITQVQLSSLCPASCLVCTEDVIICHKLARIIDAPGSTKALMLTDGLIESVDNMDLSDLSNMSILALSNNAISSIKQNAFQNLAFLSTLSLDHNRISSQTLDSSTFSWLHRLETLQLGNNNLKDIDGSWFQNSSALKTLKLEGNLFTVLNSSTFAHADLRNLETLGLSDNLIVYIGSDSFRGLPRLHSLDLSRNHLHTAPDAFSYLSRLSVLNLELNRWSCTCELRELASFLNSYIQAPEKVLYNGQRMVCVNTDNPAVQTVLELTGTNCVPPNRNITVEVVVAKSNNTSQQYIRNVAIAIVFSFFGGVGITLGMIAIAYHKLSKKLKLAQEECRAEERHTSSPETTQWNFCEGKDTLSMSHALYNSNYKSHQPCEREDSPYLGSDAPYLENHFTCHKCSSTALAVGKHKREIVLHGASHVGEQLANQRQHKGNDQHSVLQQRSKDTSGRAHNESRSRVPTSSQRRGGSNDISAVRIRQLALSNHFSALQRGTFRPPDQIHNEVTQGHHSLLKHQAEGVGARPIYQTISCLHCHQTYEYRQAGSNKQNFPFTNHSQNTGAQMYDTMLYRDILGYDKSNAGRRGEGQASELGFKLASQRSVTFDLAGPEERVLTTMADICKKESRMKSSKTSAQKSPRKLGRTKSSTRGQLKTQKTRGRAKRTLKVKLNLNPLRKNRVHPKSIDEENNEDKMSKKAKKETLRSKKDKKDLQRKDKTSKKSKDNVEGSGNEEEEDNSKMKRTKKGNKDSTSMSNDTDEVTKERGQEEQSCIPVEGETLLETVFGSRSEAQMASTLSLTLPDEHNSLTAPSHPGVLDATDTQQLSSPNVELPSQDVVDQSNSSDLMGSAAPLIQEYVSSAEGSPKRKLRLILPEKTSSRPQTALDKKIR